MKRLHSKVLLSGITMIVLSACGNDAPPPPPPGGLLGNPAGYTSCSQFPLPAGASAVPMADDLDQLITIDRTFGSTNTQGTILLCTRRYQGTPGAPINPSQVLLYGVLSIDPAVFYTGIYGNPFFQNPNQYNIVPFQFSSVSTAGTPQPVALRQYSTSSTWKYLDGYSLTIGNTGGMYGSVGQLVLKFGRYSLGGSIPPLFANGKIAQDGVFDVYTNTTGGSYGYGGGGTSTTWITKSR